MKHSTLAPAVADAQYDVIDANGAAYGLFADNLKDLKAMPR